MIFLNDSLSLTLMKIIRKVLRVGKAEKHFIPIGNGIPIYFLNSFLQGNFLTGNERNKNENKGLPRTVSNPRKEKETIC